MNKTKECAGQILVVDDEKNYRIILASLLGRAGYRVWSAAGPGPALAVLRSRAIDLVISDLCLGNLNGIDLCHKIQAEFGSLPFILFSACPPSRTSARGLSNIVGCLEKPFANRELLSLVGAALNATTENMRKIHEVS